MRSTGPASSMKSRTRIGGSCKEAGKEKGEIAMTAALVQATVPDPQEYTVSAEIWTALTTEINTVVKRIEAGEVLTNEDVKNVRSLKKQVDSYLTTFNKAMRSAQDSYKQVIQQQLDDLGYNRIETYIQQQHAKQVQEQNQRMNSKVTKIREIIEEAVAQTAHLKETALAPELLPAFTSRFPEINSGAKNKEVSNWMPYQAVITSVVRLLDAFFVQYPRTVHLPLVSMTLRNLLQYAKDGNIEHISNMGEALEADKPLILQWELRQEITDEGVALTKIHDILEQEGTSSREKLNQIGMIIQIAALIG